MSAPLLRHRDRAAPNEAVFAPTPCVRRMRDAECAHMTNKKTYKGSCFCGAVELVVTGEPVAAGYCHCASCRKWSASPVNAFTLWTREAVEIIKGAKLVATYNQTPTSFRKWCTKCGGHLLADHPPWGVVDIYGATLHDFPFHAAVHVNYGETVLHIRDGLPKQKDMPAEMGGSGTLLPE
jgi:hypothetical protein